MKIEITEEQFNSIQNEIIKLEDELNDNRDKMSTWTFIALTDKIEVFKQILADEEIDLDNLI